MPTLRLPASHGSARVIFDEPFAPSIFQTDAATAFKITFKTGEYVVTGQRSAGKVDTPITDNQQNVVHPDTKARYRCYWWMDTDGVGYVWVEAR